MANWVNGLLLLLLVFVRFLSSILKQRCCSCVVPVWTRSLEKERDMNKTTWNTVNWIRWAQNECCARKILTPFNYPTIRLPVRSFVRSCACPFVHSFVRLSIHRNDICCAAAGAAAAANASTNTCAHHRVLVCNALDNTLTQIQMYAFVLSMENESGE